MKIGRLIIEGSNTCEDYEWDEVTYLLQALINKKNPVGYWHVKVENFGWRKMSGNAYFHATDSQNLISSILPDTACNFKIHNYGKGLALQNFHHDSPCGDEWYYIKPIAESTYKKVKK